MAFGGTDVVKNLCRGYLNMRRDFFDLDYTEFTDKKMDMQKMMLGRDRRIMRYLMSMLQSVDALRNFICCFDPETCPVEVIRPISNRLITDRGPRDEVARRLMLEVITSRTAASVKSMTKSVFSTYRPEKSSLYYK